MLTSLLKVYQEHQQILLMIIQENLVHLHKYNNLTPNYLIIGMHLKIKQETHTHKISKFLLSYMALTDTRPMLIRAFRLKVLKLKNKPIVFETTVNITKGSTIKDAVNDQNPLTKKCYHKKRYYFYSNLAHNSSVWVKRDESSAYVLILTFLISLLILQGTLFLTFLDYMKYTSKWLQRSS